MLSSFEPSGLKPAKSQVEAYNETFGLGKSRKGEETTLGVEHLINEEDRQRLRAVNSQIRSYLEEITEEDPADGYLSTKISERIAMQLSDEMKAFSTGLMERKEREKIQDLATTSTLPLPDAKGTHRKGTMEDRPRAGSRLEEEDEGSPRDEYAKRRDELGFKLERIRNRQASGEKGIEDLLGRPL